jgi:FkbM family methyltransferase
MVALRIFEGGNMTNRFSSFAKKKLLGKNQNLVSINEPYGVMANLLKEFEVTGIIDAGASNGHISKRLLRKFPAAHIYAFEPNPLYAETLEQYAKEERRFHPYFLALSDLEGDAELHITESPGSTSLFTPGKRLKQMNSKATSVKSLEKVKVVTIDEWAKRNDNPEIQLMKFDIQAAELKALRGAVNVLRNSTLLVYTEICFNPIYDEGAIFSEIDLFLRKYGFALYDIFIPKYGPNGLILWANAIFLNAERLGM